MKYFSKLAICLAVFGGASLTSAPQASAQTNILSNSTFDANLFPWITSQNWSGNDSSHTPLVKAGEACFDVTTAGSEPWFVLLRQDALSLKSGTTYNYEFDARATQDANVELNITRQVGGWTGIYTPSPFSVTTAAQTFTGSFTPLVDYDDVEVDFRMGGGSLVPDGAEVCLDNIKIICPTSICPPDTADSLYTSVYLNQVGYLPLADKVATYELSDSSDNTPKTWRLLSGTQEAVGNDTAQVVLTGQTQVFGSGVDVPSGKRLHTVDFSTVNSSADNYVLEVVDGSDRHLSHMFEIGSDLYQTLKYDALSFFYHARVGVPIDAAYVGADLARGAGHVYDNDLDTLACDTSRTDEPANFECRTGIDASGGWYDAGDHGKYVVNAGISIWTLLNQYERSAYLGANAADIDDGTMQIPESSNGTSDLLDEARIGLEWVMKMQIPSGSVNAGMVHHKLHDDEWTSSTFSPADATPLINPRHIWAPSTAATLNFAALGAMCYRTYKDIDADFASMCLEKAKTAYTAAQNTPYLRSPLTDFSSDGGGQYEDLPGNRSAANSSYVQDEYYWAATELYIANSIKGDDATAYQSDMEGGTAFHLALPTSDPQTSITWAHVSGLGTLSLATVGEHFSINPSWVNTVRQAVIQRADTYVVRANTSSFNIPFDASETYWGSNSLILNNMLVMGLARDFSNCSDDSYLNAMQSGMNYLLGHNPMSKSYITGYGEDAVQNPHNRYWAHSKSSSRPFPPAGVIVGGPNEGFQDDEVAAQLLDDCSPLTCWVDELEAFSSNEITINWNAPLAWGLAYLDEAAAGKTPRACGGLVALSSTLTLATNGNGDLDLNTLNGSMSGATYQIVTPAQFGSTSINNGVLNYIATGAPTADTLTYTVTVGGLTSEPATIVIEPAVVQGGLSCTWTVTQDVNQYNGFWGASVLIENNTSIDIDGWSLDVTVGPDNQVGSKHHDDGTVFKSGAVDSESVWTISDGGWNSVILAGGNLNIHMGGFDPGPDHWEAGHNGYTAADIRKIEGDCASVATKTVDITAFDSYPDSAILTRNSNIQLYWYNETANPVYIEDEDGNRLDLVRATLSDPSTPLAGQVWIVEGPNVSAGNLRMETDIYALSQFTDLDMSAGVHTWTITTGSGLGEETSSSITFEISAEDTLRCDNQQFYTSGSQWRERIELLNTGFSVVDDWSVTLEWPTDIAPAQILNLYNSDQFTVTKIADHSYQFDAGVGGAIAPGQNIMDVIYRGINSSTHWKAKDPTIMVNPGNVNCSF